MYELTIELLELIIKIRASIRDKLKERNDYGLNNDEEIRNLYFVGIRDYFKNKYPDKEVIREQYSNGDITYSFGGYSFELHYSNVYKSLSIRHEEQNIEIFYEYHDEVSNYTIYMVEDYNKNQLISKFYVPDYY